ncbi:GvpL/GvpF family gas vesicle protein [Methylocystis bryophila]|uniref:Gas vesicle protein GvpFL n=1 Tax=Methylocystis bryophila TaxID=655015 RepID=A0A1W6MXX1_9HYPH|nr:GvpL/GvpF family gas vesicle protein [Methylocystis bryophila]ARN82431.1 hypothetical protein B1812_16590 [Methylocystis bryophila]BDV38614.1 hypothetical protein DSM21852_18670 [Methylocystis bryophila]
MGLYVYAVANSLDEGPLSVQGILERPVFQVESGPVSAIVSDCPLSAIRAERKHLAAAQRVVATINAERDILPMAFGAITKSETDLRNFLSRQRDVLIGQLQRVRGAVEMSVRITLQTEDPIAYLVSRTPELRAARDRTFAGRRPPSHEAMLRLGQMVDETFRRYRESRAAEVMSGLGPSSVELLSMPVRGEREVANIAALVTRGSLGGFEAAVHEVAGQIDDDVSFNIGGPFPPHNFVQLEPRKGQG